MTVADAPMTVADAPVRIGQRSADERLTRIFARFIAAGYLFDLINTFPTVLDAARSAPALTWITVALTFGSGAALLPASFARDYRRATAIGGAVAAVCFVGSVLAWLAVDRISPIHLTGDHFLSFIPALAAMAVAARAGRTPTICYTVFTVLVAALLNYSMAPDPDPYLPSAMFSLAFCSVFVIASTVAWRVGRRLDEAQEDALAAAGAAAAEQARTAEQQRFTALVHDDVIATLLVAARIDDPTAVAQHAGAVLELLDDYGAGSRAALVEAPDALAALAAIVRRTAPRGDWAGTCTDDAPPLPREVVDAVTSATGEALRNVLRHAGTGGHHTTVARIHAGGIDVTVRDDGAGFTPGDIAPDRLGVAGSILQRMRSLPAGRAEIHSRPGAGTEVRLAWRR